VGVIGVCQKAKEQAGQNSVMISFMFQTAYQFEVDAVGWTGSMHWSGEMCARNVCLSIGRDQDVRLRVVTR
jgi:hypothetical protein